MLQHTLTTLKSGLQVIRVPMDSAPSVTVLALCNTGSRYEAQKEFGIAHFFEHMVFKGTQKYVDAQALAAAVDGVGADFNAFTSQEYTGYYVKAAAQHLEFALDVVSDMLMVPQLRQEDIDREKGVIVEELNMYVDNPSSHIADLFDRMTFGGSGLGHNIVGTKETIRSMTSQQFKRFLDEWYGPANMVLVVAGQADVVDRPELLAQIETAFSKGQPENRIQKKVDVQQALSKSEPHPITDSKLHLEHRATEQAHVVMGWPAIARSDPDRYALNVLSVILGGNMSSRLFSEVREKRGLCYYVHSFTDTNHNSGVFGAVAGVDPKRVDEAIEVTMAEFTGLIAGDRPALTAAELARAKSYIAGKTALGLEDSESVARYLGSKQLLENVITTPQEVLQHIEAVTLDDLQTLVGKLIQPGQLRLAVIGPFEDADSFEKLRAAY